MIDYINLKRESEHLDKANEKRLMSESRIQVKALLYIVLIVTIFCKFVIFSKYSFQVYRLATYCRGTLVIT